MGREGAELTSKMTTVQDSPHAVRHPFVTVAAADLMAVSERRGE